MMNNIPPRICFTLCVLFFGFDLFAQVPAREEPHHKVVLENQYIRILDVHIPSHDTTATHTHEISSVIVFLTKSTIGTQIVGEIPVINDVNPGQTNYAAYGEKKITHRVWNQGESIFHVMDIELLKEQTGKDTCLMLIKAGAKLQLQQPAVRVYNLEMSKSVPTSLPKSSCAYLLIDISGIITTAAGGTVRTIQPGGFVFFPPNSNIQISGNNANNSDCVLLELK